MGFLKRLLGGASSRTAEYNVTFFTRIRDDARVQVVGEAFRQEGVIAARPPRAEDLPPGLPAPPSGLYKAMLTPEPSNEYDRNAVAVYLWAGRSWSKAGYLSRTDASAYGPLFQHLATGAGGNPPAVACDAAPVSERGAVGMVLHLGTPGECAVELATDEMPQPHEWTGKAIAFTGHGVTTILGAPLDRAAQLMLARWAGCVVVPRLTKKTELLVVADADEATGNVLKAREYGIETVDEPEFATRVGVAPEAVGRVSGRWARG